MMWSEKYKNHIFVFYNGELVYKRWVDEKTNTKMQNSLLLNKHWPNEWIRVTSEGKNESS